MPEPLIHRMIAGDYAVNMYLVACPETRMGVVIDPAGDADILLARVRSESIRIVAILNTHGHADPVAANASLRNAFQVPVCMHAADDRFWSDPQNRARIEAELGLPAPPPCDRRLVDGEVIPVGNLAITVIHTPGHTPGSVCFHVGNHLFTGDTLFVGNAGRTDLIGGSLDTLIHSLQTRIITLPPETVIWPGHDYGDTPTSNIGREMAENLYSTDFILAE